jgi:hypothetical protein
MYRNNDNDDAADTVQNASLSVYRDMIIILVESGAPLAIAGLCAVVGSVVRLYGVKTLGSVGRLFIFELVSRAFFLFFAVSHSPSFLPLPVVLC